MAPRDTIGLVPKIVVRVQSSAVPPVFRISMKIISARLRNVINIRSSQPAKLATVAIGYYTGLLHVVQPERQVSRAAIVDVEVGIVIIGTVVREHIGVRRQTEELIVTATKHRTPGRVHHDSRRCQCDGAQVISRIRQQGDLLGIEVCLKIGVFGLHACHRIGDVHGLDL